MKIKLILLSLITTFLFSNDIKPAMIFDTEVILDNSWNNAIYKGIKKFEKKTHINVKTIYIPPTSDSQVYKLAKEGYNPIILSYTKYRKKIIKKVMDDFPKTRFIIFNGTFNMPNANYISFSYQEISFLAGYLAMEKSKTKKIGFIGGPEIPLIKNFLCGYIKGAKYAKKDGVIEQAFIGKNFSAFNNPDKAYKIVTKQVKKGVDVIFSPSGPSSIGALKAAHDNKIFGIGVDSNQNHLFPGSILTSAVIRVDIAIFRALMAAKNNIWSSPIKIMGLEEQAMELAYDKYNKNLISKELRAKLDQITSDIILKKIDLQNYTFKNACIVEGKKIF